MFSHVEKCRSFGVHKVEFNKQEVVHWALFSPFKAGPWPGLLRRKAHITCDCYVVFWENDKFLLIALLFFISCVFVVTVSFHKAFLGFRIGNKAKMKLFDMTSTQIMRCVVQLKNIWQSVAPYSKGKHKVLMKPFTRHDENILLGIVL